MWVIYLIGIKIYSTLLRLLSPFHAKARKWVDGRRGLFVRIAGEVDATKGCIWFHFASLGEFEQGRPVLEELRSRRPDKPVVVTFYSPSGYEIRKNTPLADHVFYLPEDTPRNARRFIALINPEIAIFTKYEYWPFYFGALHRNGIPLYLISAIFRPHQVFFRWYGGLFRNALQCVTYFFTQNEESLRLLARLGHTNAEVAGDTRFDRVISLPQTRKHIPGIKALVHDRRVLVAGSTWPADETLLATLRRQYPGWLFVIAPHEIHEDHIQAIERLFPDAVRYSTVTDDGQLVTDHRLQISDHSPQSTDNHPLITDDRPPATLIVDNIGLLSSLYAYGHIAYIGGGFGKGIHNTLEAATYGIPVIFGPNYRKFQEAVDLIAHGAGFSIRDEAGLSAVFAGLLPEEKRLAAGAKGAKYVACSAGATTRIIETINGRRDD